MIVDGIIILIILGFIILGMKKGFTVCIVNFFSLIIALIIAFTFCKPATTFIIEKTGIDEAIEQNIKSAIPMSNQDVNVTIDSNLPEGIKNYINDAQDGVNDAKNSAIDKTAEELTKEIVTAIAFVIIFIIARSLLLVIKIVSKIINKLPILKQIDKIGGIICGALEGIIIVYSAFAIISIISPAIQDTNVLTYINNSQLGKQMYNNNIVINKIYSK